MKKIDLASLRNMNWLAFFGKNKYPFVSLFICIAYFYATFLGISFIVKNIRDAFIVNDSAGKNQLTGFDIDAYKKIAPRFENGAKK